jgi:hypothetical protein
MIFPYLPLPTKMPVPSLGGASVRYRPIVPVRIFGPLGSRLFDGCLDCASDDAIFPVSLARKLGIDLRGAAQGEARPVGGTVVPYSYATVTLRLSDGVETCEWQALVGFVDLPLRWALLGHAGFLDFFDTDLRGARREACLTPNTLFAGTHTLTRGPSP